MNIGDVPGYEFEVPRGPRHAGGRRRAIGHDPLRQLQRPQPEPGPRSSVRAAGSGVFTIMRKRNWLMGLAVPLLAAVAVGIAVVVVAGGGGGAGAAPSALAAGFPPARLAGASFTGHAGPASLTKTGTGQLTGVAHGPAGWLAVGTTLAGDRGPLVASSRDARNWTVTSGLAVRAVASSVAAGSAGYVIVGRQPVGK